MVKLKSSSKLIKPSEKSKGKSKRSVNSGSAEIDQSNVDSNTMLKKRKLKGVDTETINTYENEDVEDQNSVEERISLEGMYDSDNEDNNVSAPLNPGWADAMQKILKIKKPKKRKTVILSKAKKLQDVKQKLEQDQSLEVDKTEKETLKKVLGDIESDDDSVQTKSRRKDISLGIRAKPSPLDRERERMLQKIATKGVVQLFNAVRQQQTDISRKLSEAGPLERKREKVLKDIDKNTFLDVLMGGTKSVPVEKIKEPKTEDSEEKEDKMWSVLRDDFVMGAKLKDWDKKSDSGNESSSAPEDMDSDDGSA